MSFDHLKWAARQRVKRLASRLAEYGLVLRENDRRLLALRDCHRGRRGFIVASGPSLRVTDLDRLQNDVTFGCNKIYLAFEKTPWRPTYYSVLDVLVAQQNKEMIESLTLNKIFPEDVKNTFSASKDITWVTVLGQPDMEKFQFTGNAFRGSSGGWTIVYFQMQLAYFMGIRELYVIGLDFSFSVPKPTGEVCEQGAVLSSQGEQNHFDPRYRMPGEKWTMPRLDLQYRAFQCARDAFAAAGGMIYNASRKTALDVFPLVDFDKICPI